jgi:tetratricopeptide (TPR) repeat protein
MRRLKILTIGMVGVSLCWASLLQADTPPVGAPGFAQEGEDAPTPFVPKRARSEADQDHLEASALYAFGRLMHQRENLPAALRSYERAYRYDPGALAVLGEIVPLAFELGRSEEAARYAIIAAEQDPQDALLLRRLAMHLTEQEDFGRALQLYRKSFELQQTPDDVTAVLLHMEMGRLYFLEGEFPAAAKSFQQVRAAIDDPKKFGLSDELQKILIGNAHATYSLLGECFLEAALYDDAQAMFVKENEARADESEFAFRQARVLAKQQQTDAALAQLDKYFAAKATSAGVDPYDLLGELLAAQHPDPAAARAALVTRLEQLHQDDAENVALAFAYGRALVANAQTDVAEKVLAASFAQEATAETAALLVGLYRRENQVAPLLELLGATVGKSGNIESLGGAGEELLADKPLVEKLLAVAQERRAADKLTPPQALAAAMIAVRAEQFDAADDLFNLALTRPPIARTSLPKAELIITWGLELLQAEQQERAAQLFRKAIDEKLVPERQELLNYFLAGALEMQGKTDEALAALDKALNPEQPTALLLSRKAWILYHAERYEAAEQAYLALLEKFDADHKSTQNRQTMRDARLVLSNICTQTNRFDEAVEWLEQVLDEFPEDVGVFNDLGYLWAEKGMHLERALRMTQRAVAEQPENAAYRDSLGWVYFQLGRYQEAVRELEQAVAAEEPGGVILDHLGDAYARHGQADKARAAWERAVIAFEREDEPEKLAATQQKLTQQTTK